MVVTSTLNIVLLALAGLFFLSALYFGAKALGARSTVHRQAYNVGQVEAKRASQVNWIRAAFSLVLSLIFVGIFAVIPLISRGLGNAIPPTPTVAVIETPLETPMEAAPTQVPTIVSTPTSPPVTPSPEATPEPTATTTPVTATVSSGVGVWLRGAPGTTGEQLEWLLDGTVVTLLAGQETADGLLWQQVRTEEDVEGWVARDFLTVSQPTP